MVGAIDMCGHTMGGLGIAKFDMVAFRSMELAWVSSRWIEWAFTDWIWGGISMCEVCMCVITMYGLGMRGIAAGWKRQRWQVCVRWGWEERVQCHLLRPKKL